MTSFSRLAHITSAARALATVIVLAGSVDAQQPRESVPCEVRGTPCEKARPAVEQSSSPRSEYLRLKNPSESRLAERSLEGYKVVDVSEDVVGYDVDTVVMLARVASDGGTRAQVLAPYQFKWVKSSLSRLERRLNEFGRQGFRLRFVAGHFALLERSPATRIPIPEYVVVRVEQIETRLEQRLNEAAARGYRLHAGWRFWGAGLFDKAGLILEKLADTESSAEYEYRVMHVDEMHRTAAAGTLGAFVTVDSIDKVTAALGRKVPFVVLERPRTR